MKRIQFSGTTCLSNQVQSAEPLDIFELMFANELVDHITQQTNLYFKENIVGKIFKKHSRFQKHLSSASSKSELCIANEIRLFIASILYRALIRNLLLIFSIPKINFSKHLASQRYYHKID